jgi:adenine-specific DNA-methyltransferase
MLKETRQLIHQKTYTAVPNIVKKGLIEEQEGYTVKESNVASEDPFKGNILIKGDNLLALNTLKKMFEDKPDSEKVKCIYIDPPYNTGSAFENYDDNMEHSQWLSMMRDRLVILKELLREDGALFVSIDDKELAYLKILLDEVFGRKNFIGTIAVAKGTTTGQDAKNIGSSVEFILMYVKNNDEFTINKIDLNENDKKRFNKYDNIGLYSVLQFRKTGNNDRREDRPNLYYALESPSGELIYPVGPNGYESRWRASKKYFLDLQNNGMIDWKILNGKYIPYTKYYLEDRKKSVSNLWSDLEGNKKATIDLKNLFEGSKKFENPKQESIIERILEISTNSNDIVLDCFGGSGTTFAVATKMSRRWIGIEIGQHADTIEIPRLKKVLSGKDSGGISKSQNWDGGGLFSYFELGESIVDNKTMDFNWSAKINNIIENNTEKTRKRKCQICDKPGKRITSSYFGEGYEKIVKNERYAPVLCQTCLDEITKEHLGIPKNVKKISEGVKLTGDIYQDEEQLYICRFDREVEKIEICQRRG